MLDRFDVAVLRATRYPVDVANIVKSLMMQRIHGVTFAVEAMQSRTLYEGDFVLKRHWWVVERGVLGHVLMKVAACSHIYELDTSADTKDRYGVGFGNIKKGELKIVSNFSGGISTVSEASAYSPGSTSAPPGSTKPSRCLLMSLGATSKGE